MLRSFYFFTLLTKFITKLYVLMHLIILSTKFSFKIIISLKFMSQQGLDIF